MRGSAAPGEIVELEPLGVPAAIPVAYLKRPNKAANGSIDPTIVDTVSDLLRRIERGGIDEVRRVSDELDGWAPDDFRVADSTIRRATESLPNDVLDAISFAQQQVAGFAAHQRAALVDFEVETLPGIHLGQRQVAVERVGAYVPGGRVPMLAAPFMSVLVAKCAGVDHVAVCSPPRRGHGIPATVLHSIDSSGADEIYALGGVQAVACMAFGLGGLEPVDFIAGPGNAYVAEAKRQLFGRVGIDLMAGPSEITVFADDTADDETVAADLLGQAEHGPTSVSVLVTTSAELARSAIASIDRQLADLPDREAADVAARAWDDYGAALVVEHDEDAVSVLDGLAPEHLEIHAADPSWFLHRLRNYGSLFVGERTTVAFSDKAIGTNHTLPTAGAARFTAGLSVASFLKTLTYQRIDDDADIAQIAEPTAIISRYDHMPLHEATATRRLHRSGSRP